MKLAVAEVVLPLKWPIPVPSLCSLDKHRPSLTVNQLIAYE